MHSWNVSSPRQPTLLVHNPDATNELVRRTEEEYQKALQRIGAMRPRGFFELVSDMGIYSIYREAWEEGEFCPFCEIDIPEYQLPTKIVALRANNQKGAIITQIWESISFNRCDRCKTIAGYKHSELHSKVYLC